MTFVENQLLSSSIGLSPLIIGLPRFLSQPPVHSSPIWTHRFELPITSSLDIGIFDFKYHIQSHYKSLFAKNFLQIPNTKGTISLSAKTTNFITFLHSTLHYRC